MPEGVLKNSSCLLDDCLMSFWPQVVKFCRAHQERVSPLSDVDVGVLQLQRSERLLEQRLQTLGEKADGCEPLAKCSTWRLKKKKIL